MLRIIHKVHIYVRDKYVTAFCTRHYLNIDNNNNIWCIQQRKHIFTVPFELPIIIERNSTQAMAFAAFISYIILIHVPISGSLQLVHDVSYSICGKRFMTRLTNGVRSTRSSDLPILDAEPTFRFTAT